MTFLSKKTKETISFHLVYFKKKTKLYGIQFLLQKYGRKLPQIHFK